MKLFFAIKAILVLLLVGYNIQAQPYQFAEPLKIQIGFSGTFGELRSNHFHSGIDLRTQSNTGFPVHASEKGYIQRIKVSSTGYGNAIYINHPNGLTTVYAHLERFNETIAQYVARYQHKVKSFEVDLYLKPGKMEVSKNQVIGYSGNTGSSGGPHLHFEVRTTHNQSLLQPINFFPSWKKYDKINPTIDNIFVYQIDSALYLRDSLQKISYNFMVNGNTYTVTDTIFAMGKIGFGIAAHDRINQFSTRCGITGCTLQINGKSQYQLNLSGFSFTESKHINSLIDYGYYIENNKRIYRLWLDPLNTLSQIKIFDENRGAIHTKKDSVYHVTLNISDSWGNTSTVKAIVKGIENEIQPPLPPINNSVLIDCLKGAKMGNEVIEVDFPKSAFYHDIVANYNPIIDSANNIKGVDIRPHQTPMRRNFSLSIKSKLANSSIANKYFIGNVDGDKISYVKTTIANGKFTAQCSSLGIYTIEIDTIPPKIKANNFNPKYRIKNQKWLEFTLSDSSGIEKYNGYIDGNWEVFEWDLKTETIKYKLNEKLRDGTWHTVEIIATDKLNNTTKYKSKFIW